MNKDLNKDFSEYAESFFAFYISKGYVGINEEKPTGLLAFENHEIDEHSYAISEWIIAQVIKRSVPFINEDEFRNFEHIAMSCVNSKNYRFVSYMLYKGIRFFNSSEKRIMDSGKRNSYRIKESRIFKKEKYSVVQCSTIWGNKISFFADKNFEEDFNYLECIVTKNGNFYNAKDWEVS